MDNLIQMYIEEYIDLIDTENWEQFFLNMLDPDEGLTNKEIRDLFFVLEKANIDVPEQTRKEVFTNYLKENIQEYMNDEETLPIVIVLRKYCENTLGYSEDEAAQIIDENAEAWDIELLDNFGTNPPLTQLLIISRGSY